MLIYHPAFDAYHCAFRAVTIAKSIPKMELEKLRIIDFYLCFPSELSKIQLPRDHPKIRKLARAIENEYHGPVNAARTFTNMKPIQIAAVRMLAASGVFDPHALDTGVVSVTLTQVPDTLAALVDVDVSRDTLDGALRKYILNDLSRIPLTGTGGLKQRTGLMEYRYDAA